MTTDAVGGVWTYSVELCRELHTFGTHIVLATMGPLPTDAQRKEVACLSNVTLCESSYKLEWMEEPWHEVDAAAEWLLSLESQYAPDLIHINGYSHAALPWKAPVVLVAHSCVMSWWRSVKGEAAPPQWNVYKQRVLNGLLAAHVVVAPSNAMLQALDELYFRIPHARVIPNGRRCNYPALIEKEPLIFSAGRLWDEAKNIQALDNVAELVSWPVYVAGSKEHPSGAPHTDLQRVRVLPNLNFQDFSRWLAKASVYALPARYEPFGLSVLEAALAECPLVLGDIPSLRENWEGAAFFVHPEDTVALTHQLNALIESRSLRNIYGKKAKHRALQFAPEMMAAAYHGCYSELLGP